MKKLLLRIGLLSVVSLTNYAQEAPNANPEKPKVPLTPDQKAKKQTDKMTCKLNLDESQQKKFYDYSLTRITANQPIHQATRKATDENVKKKNREQMQVNRVAFDNNVKAMLNSDQLTKWEAHKERMKHKHHKCKQHKKQSHKTKSNKKGAVEELPENK